MVEQQPSKLNTRVRFPVPAPVLFQYVFHILLSVSSFCRPSITNLIFARGFSMTSALERAEGAVAAAARQRAFSVLRKAWKRRSAEGFTANELAARLGLDKGLVSRVLNGHSPTMTLETLALLLDGLGYQLRIDCEADEDILVQYHLASIIIDEL